MPVEKRRGARRGCPACGSHATEGFGRQVDGHPGRHLCLACKHTWFPCEKTCRGFRLLLTGPGGPMVLGCPECGTPDNVARLWPESHRALALKLDERKNTEYRNLARQ